jgi:hypothetical protein
MYFEFKISAKGRKKLLTSFSDVTPKKLLIDLNSFSVKGGVTLSRRSSHSE